MASEVMNDAQKNLTTGLRNFIRFALIGLLALSCQPTSAQVRIPAIDPTGTRVFAPEGTTLLTPFQGLHSGRSHGGTGARSGLFSHHRQSPGDQHPSNHASLFGLHGKGNAAPIEPAFPQPVTAIPPCQGQCGQPGCKGCKHIIPHIKLPEKPGKAGEIIMTPHRIIAPVGAEVVVLAGICGNDGHFVLNQPLEWMISNDSVGQIIEVGGMEHPNFNKMVPPTSKKVDGQYAWGRTGLKEKVLTRGTPTPCDDIDLVKGQTYVSVSSASPGTTYLTCVAPKAAGWDKRRATTIIHWVDGVWSIPLPTRATSGTTQALTTVVSRVSDSSGIPGWKIRYTIVDGAPAEFVPTGSQMAEVETNSQGQGIVQLRQQAGKVAPGTTSVRVDVIRPSMLGEAELIVESGVTTVTWSAPALAITARGPEVVPLNQAYNYRIEITNPGDQVSRGVVVRTDDLPEDLKLISANPKPSEYGRSWQWQLGDIQPGEPPRIIDVQLRGETRGMKRVCFTVSSQNDNLSTEACAETEVAAPCLGLAVTGNSSGVVGQQATFKVDVYNQCDEPLENVTITASYEAGLAVPGMANPIVLQIGRLEFGEHREIPLIFDLVGAGDQCFVLSVTADGNHSIAVRRCIEVRQASIGSATLTVDGTRLAQIDEMVETRARISNRGNTPLRGIKIVNSFSPSLEPLAATDSIPHTWAGRDLLFTINELLPGQEILLEVRYRAVALDGNAFAQFTMTQPLPVEDRLPIRIDQRVGGPPSGGGGIGIPADPSGGLTINVQSLTPSIPADGNTPAQLAFSVMNTRSTPMRNVEIVMLVPPGLTLAGFEEQYRSLNIDQQRSNDGQYFIETRRELRAGETLNFRAAVVGVRPGQMIFEVQSRSADSTSLSTGRATVNVAQ
jgi:hypothetical protein